MYSATSQLLPGHRTPNSAVAIVTVAIPVTPPPRPVICYRPILVAYGCEEPFRSDRRCTRVQLKHVPGT